MILSSSPSRPERIGQTAVAGQISSEQRFSFSGAGQRSDRSRVRQIRTVTEETKQDSTAPALAETRKTAKKSVLASDTSKKVKVSSKLMEPVRSSFVSVTSSKSG